MTIEKEIKILLNESEYNLVSNMFEWCSEVEQINHYYANINNIIDDSNSTIRVREINGIFLLQIKLPLLENGNCFLKHEFEKPIEEVPLIIKREMLENLVIGKRFDDVEKIGTLTTKRKICSNMADIQICLDYNLYLNTHDYELEIEFHEKYPYEIIKRLNYMGIYTNIKSRGKYSRFLSKFFESNK